jgi:hypothetical protein
MKYRDGHTSSGFQVDDIEAFLDQIDTREETRALDAVLIQFIWMTAARGKRQSTVKVTETHLLVMTQTTPYAIIRSSNCRSIIAVTISVT